KKEAKNIDKEIALEKKVKELDNIICKMGQSTQAVHMLTKPQVFYENNLKQALGFQNPFYLKKDHQIRLMLYDGSVIAKETNVISIADSKKTLMLEEESRSEMLLKQNIGKCFVPQQELSDEQAFWIQTLHHNTDQSASSPIKLRLLENFLRDESSDSEFEAEEADDEPEEEEDEENEDGDIEEDDDAEIIFPYEVQGDQTLPPRDESSDSEFEVEEADDEPEVEEAGVEPEVKEAGDEPEAEGADVELEVED
nr:hypothetical protein [Tanacetum cinerariifolium]